MVTHNSSKFTPSAPLDAARYRVAVALVTALSPLLEALPPLRPRRHATTRSILRMATQPFAAIADQATRTLDILITSGHHDDMTIMMVREAGQPLHLQLRRALLAEIRERALRPGDRLPSEQELEERYGVSRTTVRQAVASLVADGVARKIQGRGTFLSDPEVSHVPRLTSFTENMLAQGHVPTKELLDSRRVSPPILTHMNIDTDPGGEFRFLRRLLLADGRPIGLADTWLPLSVLEGHDEPLEFEALGSQSLYEVLAAPPLGLSLHHGSELVYASLADTEMAALLRCDTNAPALVAERTTYTAEDRVVEFTRMSFAGNRYVYRIDLGMGNQ